MKRLFAPAVTLFNKMNLLFKFLFISSLLLILIGISVNQFLISINNNITFNKKEVIGAEYAKESKVLMLNMLVYQDSLNQGQSNTSKEENNVDNAIHNLEKLNLKYDHALDNKASGKVVTDNINNCITIWKQLKTSHSTMDFNNMFEEIRKLHTNISDNSNLTLDPDLDSYYCMDVIMFRSFSIFKNLYDMGALINTIDFKELDLQNEKDIIILNTQLNTLSDTVLENMETALQFNNSKKVKLLEAMNKEVNLLQESMEALELQMNSITGNTDKENLIKSVNSCIDANSTMYDNVNKKLIQLIERRINDYEKNKTTFIIILLLSIPVLVYIYFAFMISITDNIKKINFGLNKIGEKDLSEKINITSKDELGMIGVGFNNMLYNLKNTLNIISTTATNVGNTVDNVNESIMRFDEKIQGITGAIESLSGSTEEQVASAEEMETMAFSLDESAAGMQTKARECYDLANNIDAKTRITIQKFTEAKENSESILLTTQVELEKSLESVKEVNKIHMLSDAIMQITQQTNLLALNASIEAARAGEAGKGFVVVAQEIKKLSEQSKNTTSQIGEIVKNISSAVEELSNISSKIILFIQTNVLEEYRNMIRYGKEFENDATIFNEFSQSVSQLSDLLSTSVQTMSGTIAEMTKANQNAANEIQIITSEVIELKNESGKIVSDINSVADTMSELENESNQFIM